MTSPVVRADVGRSKVSGFCKSFPIPKRFQSIPRNNAIPNLILISEQEIQSIGKQLDGSAG